MSASRRDFLKKAGLTVGAAALIPTSVLDAEATVDAKLAAEKNRLADIALSTARKLGATYADIRINRYRQESVTTREQQVLNVARTQNFGFGVRVLVKGTWGFASSRDVDAATVRRVTGQAIEIARANSAYQRKPVRLVPVKRYTTSWRSVFERDPFEVPVE